MLHDLDPVPLVINCLKHLSLEHDILYDSPTSKEIAPTSQQAIRNKGIHKTVKDSVKIDRSNVPYWNANS